MSSTPSSAVLSGPGSSIMHAAAPAPKPAQAAGVVPFVDASARPQWRILIADDDAVQRMIAAKVVKGLGHEPVLARDGQEAIDLFVERGADLVLMDIMMPRVDGLQALARIKELAGNRWVPVICLSGLEQDADLFRALETGADDYLRKPVGTVLLEHKLRAVGRSLELQRQREQWTTELENYRIHAEEEKRVALHLMDRLIEQGKLGAWPVRYWQRAAESFCGDLVAAARTPAGQLHVLLSDATGHGLSAALNVMPVVSVFYGMTLKGFDLSSIAVEINKKLKQLMPIDRFVAATLASIDFSERLVTVWNGGNPATLLVARDGRILQHWKSRSPPLGVIPPRLFEPMGVPYRFDEPCWLYVCSDGLLEAENADGEQYGLERLTQDLLTMGSDDEPLGLSIRSLEQHLNGLDAADDVTILTVDLDAERAMRESPPAADRPTAVRVDGDWQFSVVMGPAEIRRADLPPMLMTLVDTLAGSDAVRGHVMTVVTELIANAIDHGLLKLQSSLKEGPGGFETYFEERNRRLAELKDASLKLDFKQIVLDQRPALRIRIEDSGPGFAWQRIVDAPDAMLHGRGMSLLRRLTVSLNYEGCGNVVEVVIPLDDRLPG